MITKFGKILNAILLAFIVSTTFNACSNTASNANLIIKPIIDPKIVGSWKNTDEKITSRLFQQTATGRLNPQIKKYVKTVNLKSKMAI